MNIILSTCFSICGWLTSSGMKARQMCIEGTPATVTGNSLAG
jgi:hypothetical protein